MSLFSRFRGVLGVMAALLLSARVLWAQPAMPAMPDVPPEPPAAAPAAPPAETPATVPAAAPLPAPGLRMQLAQADHPSGVYYAKEDAKFSLLVDNPGDAPAVLDGQLEFGATPVGAAPFKALAITPITAASVGPRQRVRLTVAATFGGPGAYEVRWRQKPVELPGGLALRCIFPPRAIGTATPWIASVSRAAATTPGYLADFKTRTGIGWLVLEDPWPTAEESGQPRFGGALALTAGELDTLLAEAHNSGVQIVLRVSLAADAPNGPAQVYALHEHIVRLLKAGAVRAIVVQPHIGPGARAETISAYASFYLAVYDAAKKHDKTIQMLGAGSTTLTEAFLLTKPKNGSGLQAYVDAIAAMPLAPELWRVHTAGPRWQNRPIWMLPLPPGNAEMPRVSPALLLAENVRTVPVPDDDRGTTAHLFGGAVFFQRVRTDLPVNVLVFQGTDYAVAAICGLGAGSPADMEWPGLSTLVVTPQHPPTLEVADANDEFRMVDEAGNAVDCRFGDIVQAPLDARVRYLLSSDPADDMVALLRTSPLNNGPLAAARVIGWNAARDSGVAEVKVSVRNAASDDLTGTLRLLLPAPAGGGAPEAASAAVVAEKNVSNIAPGQAVEWIAALTGMEKRPAEILVEVASERMTQRFIVAVPPAP